MFKTYSPGFKFWVHQLLALWPWTSFFSNFFIHHVFVEHQLCTMYFLCWGHSAAHTKALPCEDCIQEGCDRQ